MAKLREWFLKKFRKEEKNYKVWIDECQQLPKATLTEVGRQIIKDPYRKQGINYPSVEEANKYFKKESNKTLGYAPGPFQVMKETFQNIGKESIGNENLNKELEEILESSKGTRYYTKSLLKLAEEHQPLYPIDYEELKACEKGIKIIESGVDNDSIGKQMMEKSLAIYEELKSGISGNTGYVVLKNNKTGETLMGIDPCGGDELILNVTNTAIYSEDDMKEIFKELNKKYPPYALCPKCKKVKQFDLDKGLCEDCLKQQ